MASNTQAFMTANMTPSSNVPLGNMRALSDSYRCVLSRWQPCMDVAGQQGCGAEGLQRNTQQPSGPRTSRLDPNDPFLFEPPVTMKRKVALAIGLLTVGSVLLGVGLSEFYDGTAGGAFIVSCNLAMPLLR